VLRVTAAALIVYAGLVGMTWLGLAKVPRGFVPSQDKSYLVAFAQLPDAATLDRTEAVIRKMSAIALQHPGVANSVAFPGLSVNGFVNASNTGIVFVTLKPEEQRKGKNMSAGAIAAALNAKYAGIQEAFVAIFPPPPVQGLGTVGGFKLYVEVRNGSGFEELYSQVQGAVGEGYKRKELGGLFSSFQVSVPQVDAHVDRERAKTYGVDLTDVFETLQVYLGSLYVNDFNRFGRTYQVNVQAESKFRIQPEMIRRLETRNRSGGMVPLGSLVTVERGYGPEQVMHYNGFPAAEINGAPAPGFSSGQAQSAIADVLHKRLPAGMSFEWTELAYQEILSGNTMVLIFPLCVLLVYVVLAAQYESWWLPLSVILIVPMTILSAVAGVWVTGGDNNVFTQISFLVLAGLACKNSILIVEFAKHRVEHGDDRVTAILEACRVRLRPVLMTSIAFIMGVLPLVFSSGAGAEIRRAMGVAVFAGMLGVTAFGLFLTPVFFTFLGNVVERVTRRRLVPIAAAASLILGGCATAPYQQPKLEPVALKTPESFDRKPYDAQWWHQFEDPVLDSLESAALASNDDVRAAVARFDEARAVFRDASLDRFPTMTANAFADRRKEFQVETSTYRAGFDALWELDLFGRVRSQVQSAKATAESFQASLDDVRVVIAAEVARNYFELRGLQQQTAGRRAESRQSTRDAAADDETPRRGNRRRARRGARIGARRRDRCRSLADQNRDRGAPPSTGRADGAPSRRAERRSFAACVCAAGEGPAAR
jgi:multidrug efflux pump